MMQEVKITIVRQWHVHGMTIEDAVQYCLADMNSKERPLWNIDIKAKLIPHDHDE